MKKIIEIEYVEELGDSPIMVVENDTKQLLLLNSRLPKEEQDWYISLARGKSSEELHYTNIKRK